MAIYAFFIKRDKDGNSINERLYAIARDKASKELFEELRNMKYFNVMKFKDKKEFFRQCNKQVDSFNKYMLSLVTFNTKNEFGNIYPIQILATWEEEEKVVLYHDRKTEKMVTNPLPSANIFNKKFKKYLKVLGYDELSRIANINVAFIDRYDESAYINPEVNFLNEAYRFDVDEFKVFMKLYGYTMKG